MVSARPDTLHVGRQKRRHLAGAPRERGKLELNHYIKTAYEDFQVELAATKWPMKDRCGQGGEIGYPSIRQIQRVKNRNFFSHWAIYFTQSEQSILAGAGQLASQLVILSISTRQGSYQKLVVNPDLIRQNLSGYCTALLNTKGEAVCATLPRPTAI